MVQINVDPTATLAFLEGIRDRYQEGIAKGFAEAGRLIVDLFRNDWLSGRGADDLGLNIQTGRLRQSIRSVTVIKGNVVTSEVFNRGAQYWEYHQTGTDRLPKRLYLEETFQEDGAKLYESQIDLALKAVA